MSEPNNATPSRRFNPFATRDDFSTRALFYYKLTTSLSYALTLVTAIYYSLKPPADSDSPHRRFWQHNISTPFAQNSVITSVYWIILFIAQISHIWSLFSRDTTKAHAAASVGGHFVANNLLLFGFTHLWVRAHYWLAELLLIVNFANLSIAYFRYSATPRHIHVGAVSGPLAWNFTALYWVGAVAVHSNSLIARVIANIFIWGWAGYGLFFLVAYKDYTMGIALSVMAFSTGVGQFLTSPVILQLQWIFAFTVGGLLFLLSLAVGIPGLLGRDPFKRGLVVSEDRERAPLLADE